MANSLTLWDYFLPIGWSENRKSTVTGNNGAQPQYSWPQAISSLDHPQVPLIPVFLTGTDLNKVIAEANSNKAEESYIPTLLVIFAVGTTAALIATGKLKFNLRG